MFWQKAVDDSNIQIRQANASRKKKQALSELDAVARDTGQHMLEKANAMRMEQEDEVKKLNEVVARFWGNTSSLR